MNGCQCYVTKIVLALAFRNADVRRNRWNTFVVGEMVGNAVQKLPVVIKFKNAERRDVTSYWPNILAVQGTPHFPARA